MDTNTNNIYRDVTMDNISEANVGQTVKAGDAIVVLEAMKMEIPVVAPQDGVVAGINVAVGDTVENGDVLASMN